MVRLPSANDVLQMIVDALMPVVAPELILLFGSRAKGEPRQDSDYDLMLVLSDDADVAAARKVASDDASASGYGTNSHSPRAALSSQAVSCSAPSDAHGSSLATPRGRRRPGCAHHAQMLHLRPLRVRVHRRSPG
jgi:hypothetical protein